MGRRPIPRRPEPRITANDLALYMVSSETARIGIIQRAADPQVPPIRRYSDARSALCAYLTDPIRQLNPLIDAEEMLQQRADDPATGSLFRDDALHSIEVLHAIQEMRNQLAGYDFRLAPRNEGKLNLNGVEVSVWADMLVYGSSRREDQIGGAILRMTVSNEETEAALARRRELGLYVATLVRMHMEQNIPSNRVLANRLCMSIDVQHGEVFTAPNASVRRMNDLRNACLFVAAMWPR